MHQCPACGQPNAPDVDFCASCGKYLGWATRRLPKQPVQEEQPDAWEDLRAPSSEPVPDPGDREGDVDSVGVEDQQSVEQRAGVQVELNDQPLAVAPGSELQVTATVHNTGTRVEEYLLRLTGAAASYGIVEPTEVSVYPGSAQCVAIRFTPAREPEPAAGATSYVVEATSTVHAGVGDRAVGNLTVEPFAELHADLQPRASRGRTTGRHRVQVSNTGNVALSVDVTVQDQDSVLEFEPTSVAERISNGETLDLPLVVSGRRRWFGRSRSHSFTAEVVGGERPITLAGVRHQEAMFPWWVPPATLAMVVLVAAFVVVSGFLGKVEVPQTAGFSESRATVAISQAGLLPESRVVVTEEAPADQVVGTFPEAGSNVDPGTQVLVMVSLGERSDGQTAVPGLAGLPEEAAEVLAEAANVELEVREQVSAEPAGTVLATDPGVGLIAAQGSTVTATISAGPSEADAVEVPDVSGLSVDEAVTQLNDAGLQVAVESAKIEDADPDEVVTTLTEAGTEVGRGATVTLVVPERARQ